MKRLDWMKGWWLSLLLLTGVGQAAIQGVTLSVSPRQVPLGKTTMVRLTWVVRGVAVGQGQNNFNGPVVTVRSPSAAILGFGPNLQGPINQFAAISRSLSRIVPAGGYNLKFVETLTIPAATTYAAYKMGYPAITVQRTFSDGQSTFPGPVPPAAIRIVGSGGAGLALGRQTLYFDDGSERRVIDQDKRLRALTRISYSGSGLLKGVWELADPTSTSGQPLFRAIKNVRRFIATGGEVILHSPPLKTDRPGRYLVRFRIQEPVPFDQLSIEYFVGRKPISEPPVKLALDEPGDGAIWVKDQRFRWRPDPAAVAYRLEIFEKGVADPVRPPAEDLAGQKDVKSPSELKGAPVSGALVPASDTSLALSGMSEAHLRRGYAYWWRVLAIGRDGKVISQSPVREIRVP